VVIVPIPATARFNVLTGRRFGRWTVLGWSGRRHRSYIVWVCRCDCGREADVHSTNLLKGHSQSCGCRTRLSTSHQHISQSPEYAVWQGMISRCHRRSAKSFPDYGGRGIYVCERWRFGQEGIGGFLCFLADMGERPSPKHSIDRIDNDGPYDTANCEWKTRQDNNQNRRNTKMVIYRGESMPLTKACELAGLPYNQVCTRITRGWSFERALGTPL